MSFFTLVLIIISYLHWTIAFRFYSISNSNIFIYKKTLVDSSRIFSASVDAENDQREIVKIFGRLADKQLLLNVEGAGTPEMANCCHGGCDNCNYSRIFDSMSAGRAKWIALYTELTLIDGRSHTSSLASLFDKDAMLSKESFRLALQSLPYKLNMGPPSVIPSISSEEVPSEKVIDKLWNNVVSVLKEEYTDDFDLISSEKL